MLEDEVQPAPWLAYKKQVRLSGIIKNEREKNKGIDSIEIQYSIPSRVDAV